MELLKVFGRRDVDNHNDQDNNNNNRDVLSVDGPSFIASSTFTGAKPGYYFGTTTVTIGKSSSTKTGYYLDPRKKINGKYVTTAATTTTATTTTAAATSEAVQSKKRALEESVAEIAKSNSRVTREMEIKKLLDEADNNGDVDNRTLDIGSARALLSVFEKAVSRNQQQRIKYSEEPMSFMESELNLLQVMNKDLSIVAAYPEFLRLFVETESLSSLLSLLTHENVDVVLAVLDLLDEFIDSDITQGKQQEEEQEEEEKDGDEQAKESMQLFVQGCQQQSILELLVALLTRLNETAEEEAIGVAHIFNILTSILDIDADAVELLLSSTPLLSLLLKRVNTKAFTENKLLASELLVTMVQASTYAQVLICTDMNNNSNSNTNKEGNNTDNGMDLLLQSLSMYRKRMVEDEDERECVQNLFLTLCTVLLLPDLDEKQQQRHQQIFVEKEGFELMLRFLKEQNSFTENALKVINHAITNNTNNNHCLKLLELGGLKYIFPLLQSHQHKQKQSTHQRTLLEQVISLLAQLCLQLGDAVEMDAGKRLLTKFLESNDNKQSRLERLVALFDHHLQRLETTQKAIAMMLTSSNLSSEELLLLRLEGGLFSLQQVSTLLLFVCAHDATAATHISQYLGKKDLSWAHVDDVIEDMLDQLNQASEGGGGVGEEGKGNKTKQVLTFWRTHFSSSSSIN